VVDDFKKGIDSRPSNIYENMKIEKITDKHQKDEEELKRQKEMDLAKGAFLMLVKTYLLRLKRVLSKSGKTKQAAIKDLKELKKSLERLTKENASQDIDYLEHLANVWMQFLDDFAAFPKDNKILYAKIKSFVDCVMAYPEKTEYSLGYYLSEFAGFEWIPFPYMEILQNLFLQYQKSPKDSILQEWIGKIDEITKA
jgi:hypothetical protein